MSNAIDDFLIRLGFDTSAIKKELGEIHRAIEGVEKKATKRRTWANLNAAEKEAKIKQQITERAEKASLKKKQDLQKSDMNSHVVAFQKQQQKLAKIAEKTSADSQKRTMAQARAIQRKWDQRKLNRAVSARREQATTEMRGRFASLARDISSSARARGADSELTSTFSNRIVGANSVAEAKRYAEALRQVSTRLNALDAGGRRQLLNIVREGDMSRLVLFNRELGTTAAAMNRAKRSAISLQAAQNSLHDSTRNLIRQYASLYAVFAGTAAIANQVKALDSAKAGMNAVSASAEEANANMMFIRQTALKNGLAMADSAKQFVKLKAAIGDKLGLEETQEAFTSLTKAGVVFQLSTEEQSRSIKAIQQMFSKSGIMAEELKQQLGDVMPIAMRALEKSTGKTAKELFKMMEMGQLGAEYIQPFVMALGDLASANGAYEKALKSLSVTEGRFRATAGVAAETIGEKGFREGLVKFYEELMRILVENEHALGEIGKTFNVIFRGIAKLLRISEPLVAAITRAFGSLARVVEYLNEQLGTNGLILVLGGTTLALGKLSLAANGFAAALARALLIPIAKLTLIIGLFDEIRAYFDEDVIGMFDDTNWTPEQRAEVAKQRRSGNVWYQPNDERSLGGKIWDTVTFGAPIPKLVGMANNAITAKNVMSNSGTQRAMDDLNSIYTPVGGSAEITVINQIDGQEVSRHTTKHALNQIQQGLAQTLPAGGM